jgi:hypothetical protein
MDWRATSATPPPMATTNAYWIRAGEAYLALARADSSAALQRFASVPREVGAVYFEQLTPARLLVARGDACDALAILDRGFPLPRTTLSMALWELERARLAEKLNHPEKVLASYHFVADVWRHADPELQPYVEEARTALARLGAEPRTPGLRASSAQVR